MTLNQTLNAALALALLCAGCSTAKPLKGGRSKASTGGHAPVTVEASQPENPAQPMKQTVQDNVETVIALPQGSKVTSVDISWPAWSDVPVTNRVEVVVSEPAMLTRRVIKAAATEIGSAQQDTSREIGAKLAAVRPIQYLGAFILLAGVAMFHPAVRLITGSGTLQVGCFAVGAALIFLPMLLAGHERLVLLIGLAMCAALLVWYLAHRHGQLRGFIDANQDGIDDRKQ